MDSGSGSAPPPGPYSANGHGPPPPPAVRPDAHGASSSLVDRLRASAEQRAREIGLNAWRRIERRRGGGADKATPEVGADQAAGNDSVDEAADVPTPDPLVGDHGPVGPEAVRTPDPLIEVLRGERERVLAALAARRVRILEGLGRAERSADDELRRSTIDAPRTG